MSQAEDLLNGLEEPIAMYSVNPESEPHIVINPDKSITVPDELKHIAVQGDHNIETVTFDCPRYWDGHDLSKMSMRIVYQRPDGHREPHPVENPVVDEIDENIIHFDWTISGNVTLVKGSISFLVCAKLSNVEGLREREWHTRLNQDLVIDEGMDCSGEEIVEQNPDIIESILARLEIAEQGGVSKEAIAQAVENYLDENPGQTGATAEQAAQIQQNKTDIETLVQAKESGEFKGEPGDDYVLTEADKTEIAEMAAGLVEVPEGGTGAGIVVSETAPEDTSVLWVDTSDNEVPDLNIPSDDHINDLINAALGVIENGTY